MENTAAWLKNPKQYPVDVGKAPYPEPGKGQLVVKTKALAINPVNWKIQESDIFPLNYPTIMGEDYAGEVVQVGEDVTRFHVGDRVLGYTGSVTSEHDNTKKAFQKFILAEQDLLTPIPNSMKYEEGAVIPLGIATAACVLYQPGFLGFPLPSLNSNSENKDKVIIVWGGSSSIGSSTIQLANASGYTVYTTASPHNFDFCENLGASRVFDYKSESIDDDIVEAIKVEGLKVIGGFDCVSESGVCGSFLSVMDKTDNTKPVIMAVQNNKTEMDGIKVKWVFSQLIIDSGVAKSIFVDYLPQALENGKYIAAPMPFIAGQGLESVQTAMDILKEGVSGRKVVVTL